jgi:hypothetical protein
MEVSVRSKKKFMIRLYKTVILWFKHNLSLEPLLCGRPAEWGILIENWVDRRWQKYIYLIDYWPCMVTVKVKQSHYRPWQALRVLGEWDSQILKQSAHEGSKVVMPTHRPPLPQKVFLVLISVRGRVNPRAIVRPDGLYKWKIPKTPSGIDPATFRFVAQCLNHCATAYVTLLFPHEMCCNQSTCTVCIYGGNQ